MENSFQVSVIIPAYNAERTLSRAIDSVLRQTVPVSEIILIDDGSTDATSKIARSYGDAIRYFHQSNVGLSGAMNSGIEHAQGEWIVVLDADDEWLPDFVASHAELVRKNPDLKWTYSPCEIIRPGGRHELQIPSTVKEQAEQEGFVSFFRAAQAGLYFGKCGLTIRGCLYEDLGHFDPAMRNGMDGDMWRRIALKYPQIGVCGKVGWHYYCDSPKSLHHEGKWCRDLQVKSLCKNMHRAMELDTGIVNEYSSYAQALVMRDLMREAARDCSIRTDIMEEAKLLFPLTGLEKGLLRILRLSPKPIAIRLVDRLMPS